MKVANVWASAALVSMAGTAAAQVEYEVIDLGIPDGAFESLGMGINNAGQVVGWSGHSFAESFYILDGTVSLLTGDRWIDAGPGDYLYVPPGGIHAFANNSGLAASMLVLFTPGAPREPYFRELAEIAASGRRLTEPEWTALYARHDQYEAPV